MKVIGWGALFLVGVFVLIAVMSSFAVSSRSDAISFAKDAISSMLKDPGSAKFDSVHFNQLIKEKDHVAGYVCGYVNGKNSFGGYVGSTRFLVLTDVTNKGKAGKSIGAMIDSDDNFIAREAFQKRWEENCH